MMDRFWNKVKKTQKCWLWTAYIFPSGYGGFKLAGKSRTAHSVAYELTHGLVPNGLQLDHLCRTRHCVNPQHLEPVTARVNIRRGNSGLMFAKRQLAKTHCPQGHEYNAVNTYNNPNKSNRHCRICAQLSRLRYQEKRKNEI